MINYTLIAVLLLLLVVMIVVVVVVIIIIVVVIIIIVVVVVVVIIPYLQRSDCLHHQMRIAECCQCTQEVPVKMCKISTF